MIISEFEATLFLPPLHRGMFNKKKTVDNIFSIRKRGK